ncbi:hypothetical protein ACFOD9_03040 [Novosphingobium bradum]|uniref:Lysine transporter LysE n=1 Tax=Novosphingobium bradum TaxID=1737444 RepID=A0ABV7IKK8_9SPHN
MSPVPFLLPVSHAALSFVIAALALLVMPGPTNLLLAAGAERVGWARGLRLIPVVILAYAIGIALVAGMIGLFPGLPLALGFKLAALAWLVWLALRIWRAPELARAGAGGGAGALFVTTLTNPKVVVFACLLIPPAPLPGRLALLAPLIALSSGFYLLLGAGLVRLGLSQRVLWRGLAAVLLGFAGLAAASVIR